jgi:P-type Cu+ transporter
MALDPVCGMTVDPARAAGQLDHDGTTYYFCSKGCLAKFAADPQKYVSGMGEPGTAPVISIDAVKRSAPHAARAPEHPAEAPGHTTRASEHPAGITQHPTRAAEHPA